MLTSPSGNHVLFAYAMRCMVLHVLLLFHRSGVIQPYGIVNIVPEESDGVRDLHSWFASLSASLPAIGLVSLPRPQRKRVLVMSEEKPLRTRRKRGRPRRQAVLLQEMQSEQGTGRSSFLDSLLPPSLSAEIAPLPIPFAHYHLTRLSKQFPRATDAQLQARFLTSLREARETAFEVLDDFVRNRHEPIAPDLRLSTEWLLKELAAYDPKRTMPDSTFKNWQKRGLIRMEAWGKPRPSNAAAVLIMRMLDRQKENIFPFTLAAEEPDYWCYVKEFPTSSLDLLPVSHLHLLPPSAVVWTPWAGASWEHGRWHLMGENEAHLGSIRFAGTRGVRGERWWNINWSTLTTWEPAVAPWYLPSPGHHDRQVETLATLVLERLFLEHIPQWRTQTPQISRRLETAFDV